MIDEDILNDLIEYLEKRADADFEFNDIDGSFQPNEEMQLLDRLESFKIKFEKINVIEMRYEQRLSEYNRYVAELEIKRKKFYEDNPDFPYGSMYVNVVAPPQKIEIKTL